MSHHALINGPDKSMVEMASHFL